MRLSILDQAPVIPGATEQEALHESIRLAQLGDQMGFTRYWIAEHHDLHGLACPAPEVMLGIIGAQTKTIRIGAGAVLLPHYKPFKVAETFNLLATLYPNRLDLGLGRSPGGSAEVSMALSTNFLENVRQMPQSINELLHYLNNTFPNGHMFSKVKPTPVPSVSPIPWLLGTSEKSAILAAEKGMAYAFGHFMSEQNGPAIIEKYKQEISKVRTGNQDIIVAISVYCADTTEEAEELAMSSILANLQREKGNTDVELATSIEINNFRPTEDELEQITKLKQKMVIGNPTEVKNKLLELQDSYGVDEFMILTNTSSYQARRRSYELLAKEILF